MNWNVDLLQIGCRDAVLGDYSGVNVIMDATLELTDELVLEQR